LTFNFSRHIFNHMVNNQSHQLDTVFHALSDPTRRAMLRQLARNEDTIGNLAAPFNMSLAAASKHVKVLEHAGLIRRTIRGRRHICRLNPKALANAQKWLQFYERFWNEKLDALESLLNKEDDPEK
jgi:DNA-binding transcriptional ArsR family regulator